MLHNERIINKPDWAFFDPTTGKLSGTPENAHVGCAARADRVRRKRGRRDWLCSV